MQVILLVGIFSGVFTATEAAAVSVVYAIGVEVLIFRAFGWREVFDIAKDSAVSTGVIFILLAMGALLAYFITLAGADRAVLSLVREVGVNWIVFMILVNIVFLTCAMFLDPNSIMVIFLPTLFPVAAALGIDPVHFGMVVTLNVCTGMIMPPLGLDLAVAASTLNRRMELVVAGIWPFILTNIAVLILISYIPPLSTFLPRAVRILGARGRMAASVMVRSVTVALLSWWLASPLAQAATDVPIIQAPKTSAPGTPYEPQHGQDGKDVVWVPTAQDTVERMLDMAAAKPGDYVIDLGSGDGRTVISAAKRGIRALGIEYNPDLVELSRRNAAREGVAERARFVEGDIFKTDFSEATVLTLYLSPQLNMRLRPAILTMKPGTRVVSHSFNMGDWEPDGGFTGSSDHCKERCSAYFWVVPARVAGTWQIPEGTLRLEQKLPEIHRHVHDRRQGAQDRGRPRARRGDHLHRGWREVRGHDEGEDADGEAGVRLAKSSYLRPHPEERTKCASRRMVRPRSFETALRASSDEAGRSCRMAMRMTCKTRGQKQAACYPRGDNSAARKKIKSQNLSPPSGAASYCAQAGPTEGVSRTSASGTGERWPRVMRNEGCTNVHPARGGPSRELPQRQLRAQGGSWRRLGVRRLQRATPVSRPPAVVDSKVSPPGVSRSKPQTPRAGRRRHRRTCGLTNPDRPAFARERARGSTGAQASRAPSDLFESATRSGRQARPAPSQIRAAERWLCQRDGLFDN